ncbi:carbohydrate kinase [uncultured Thiothrix sp.]|mgnify:FL=1|uniref:carbohydrate kinase family protein n=1 Tax=uncultured Thiothrix sp. TaxID=223185 RepID=UPI002609B46C|nr:carbohydrate kinase [uncultured Thiothrix sp.]
MFVVCGEALFDVFTAEVVDQAAFEVPLSARVGGSPLNVAVGLARLGCPVAMLTGLSTDFLGERLLASLQSEGVKTHLIARKQAPTTLGFVQQDAAGVPSYAFYGNGAADRLLTLDDVNVDLEGTAVIHFGSYSIVAQPTADSYFALAQQHSGKRLLSLDPNVRLNVEPRLAIWKQRIAELLPLFDIVKVSDEDLHLLYPEQQPEAIVESWLQQGPQLVALTRGGKGASLWSHHGQVDVPGQAVQVIDTVGAGDTFQASLLDAVVSLKNSTAVWSEQLNNETLFKIGHTATVAAAITCSRRGANLPTRAEIQAAL